MGDIVDVITATEGCETLVAALRASGVADALRGVGPFTLFAPADEAFDLLPPGTLDMLLDDPPRLLALLRYHIVPGELVQGGAAWPSGRYPTLQGQPLQLRADGEPHVNDARLLRADLPADNGRIHLIDRVLVPS